MILAWQLPLAAGNDWLSLLFFVIIVLGPIVVQAIKKLRGETDDESTPTPTPPPRGVAPTQRPPTPPRQAPVSGTTAQSEEIRKFLEALGKPKSTPPPPPILRPVQQQSPQRPPPRPKLQRPAPPPPRPVLVASEGVSEEEGEAAPRNIITGESTRHEFKAMERIDLSQAMAAVELEVAQAAKPMTVVASVAGSNRATYFAQLLANKTNVRQAVVLAEVIGPPKAFV